MNVTCVDFLDVKMDISSGTYKPFIKGSTKIRYVNTKSDHWDKTIQHIPNGIEKRLNAISSSKEMFDSTSGRFQEGLIKSGYTHQLKWEEQGTLIRRKLRKKRITWFNPISSQCVKTNIGREFIRLVGKWFTPNPSLKS